MCVCVCVCVCVCAYSIGSTDLLKQANKIWRESEGNKGHLVASVFNHTFMWISNPIASPSPSPSPSGFSGVAWGEGWGGVNTGRYTFTAMKLCYGTMCCAYWSSSVSSWCSLDEILKPLSPPIHTPHHHQWQQQQQQQQQQPSLYWDPVQNLTSFCFDRFSVSSCGFYRHSCRLHLFVSSLQDQANFARKVRGVNCMRLSVSVADLALLFINHKTSLISSLTPPLPSTFS